jgi:uncharacterized protein (DUF885 family)
MNALTMAAVLTALVASGCTPAPPPAPAAGSGDPAYHQLASAILEDHYTRNPTEATDLGLHKYDAQLEDLSESGLKAESAALKDFRTRLAAIDPSTLTTANVLDREQLLRSLDSRVLSIDAIRMWAKDPDAYSSAITASAYVIMKRPYAPAADRLKALIEREKKFPAVLQHARTNLTDAVPIYTQIAIEQIDGNISFFKNDVPAAFSEVADQALLTEFKRTNAEVMTALSAYKTFLEKELLPKASGSYAYGPETYSKALVARDGVDLPLDRLLQLAEADRQKNDSAFHEVVKEIDPAKPADRVLASIQLDHPPASKLLETTQNSLDAIRQFIVDHHIVTIPPSEPARVKETPPFMRSTTSASMDIPGPFETAALPAFYNMTLPDPRKSRAEQDEFMRNWYYAAIANVSIHEVYPGHFIQFLYAKTFPSDVRKVFGANTNIEGWAHYCEQMMFDEGYRAGEPTYRLAQLQDALLRDVRFIVGIKMHTQGMSVDEATRLFETQAYQPHPVAVLEAKRGTSGALYGYYTLGKLMILKLRDDYKAKMGAAYSLQAFHDAFITLGPLPLPLIRRAMLGEVGAVL